MRRLLLALALSLVAGAAAAAQPLGAKPLAVGFYLPWDAASRASTVAHAGALDILAPMSGALDSAAGTVRWQPDPALGPALAAAKVKPKVFPVVSNAHDNVWDAAAADAALTDPKAGDAFIAALAAQARAQGYGGYVLDLESLSPGTAAAYPALLTRLHAALRPLGKALWVTATLSTDPALLQQLADATDAVVLMAYDQCWATGTPGPIAAQDWLEAMLDAKLGPKDGGADPSRYVVALGAYGYDWPAGQPAQVVSAPQAVQLAKANGQAIAREAPAASPHFAYTGSTGDTHAVWYLDAAAFRTQRAAALARHVRGVAVWRLGLEDPAIWARTLPTAALGAAPATPRPACVALPH
jgi:spore germination protein YaaH